MGTEHLDIKKAVVVLVLEFLCRNIESCIVLNIGGVKLILFTAEGWSKGLTATHGQT